MPRKVISFAREGKVIIAQVYSRYFEPLGRHSGYLEVFFCQDTAGNRYRVQRNDVLVTGVKPREKKKVHKKCKTA